MTWTPLPCFRGPVIGWTLNESLSYQKIGRGHAMCPTTAGLRKWVTRQSMSCQGLGKQVAGCRIHKGPKRHSETIGFTPVTLAGRSSWVPLSEQVSTTLADREGVSRSEGKVNFPRHLTQNLVYRVQQRTQLLPSLPAKYWESLLNYDEIYILYNIYNLISQGFLVILVKHDRKTPASDRIGLS